MKQAPGAHIAYLIAIVVKGAAGLIEMLLGLLLATTGPQRLYSLVLQVITPELENGNRAAVAVQHGAAGLAQASAGFTIFYLLTHGILKAGLAINLLRGRRWMFAPACVILAGFILYLSYHATRHFSWWLVGLAAFDFLTLALVLNEWSRAARDDRA